MSANEKQVGGTHYATEGETQHWDWVTQNRIPYLEAVATKYVCRWKKKNGREDLEKAEHYITKLIEQAVRGYCRPRELPEVSTLRPLTLTEFTQANSLGQDEEAICRLLSNWTRVDHLRTALAIVTTLLRGV